MSDLIFAVVGAGAGGQSMAAVLKSMGYQVRLHDKNAQTVARLNELGKIRITGAIELEATPDLVTDDLAQAVTGANMIMVCSTTDGHRDIAQKMAPCLGGGEMVLLNPGHVGGAMEVAHILRTQSTAKDLVVGEAGDLMYACRVMEVGEIFHSGLKKKCEVATMPAGDVDRLLEVLKPIFPILVPAKSVLYTGLESGGAMLHPIPTLMNLNRIDAGQPFDYYMEGITPSIAKLIELADRERLAVCAALGLQMVSLVDQLREIYELSQTELYDLLQHNKAYVGVKSPRDLGHRFVVEDITCGLVPLSSLGKQLGVPTPMLDAFIHIGSVAAGRDYMAEGRTVEKLGLAGKTKEEIVEFVS